LQLLFLSQGFSHGAFVPFEAVLWGPRAEAEQGPKLGIFIDEQGVTGHGNAYLKRNTLR